MYCQPGSGYRVQFAFCLFGYDCSWRVGGVSRVRAIRGDLPSNSNRSLGPAHPTRTRCETGLLRFR